MANNTLQDEFVEMFTIEIRPDEMKPFMDARPEVDAFLQPLEGFLGTDVILLSEYQLLILLRWCDAEYLSRALPVLTRSPLMRSWLGRATSCTQQPAIAKTSRCPGQG